MHLSRAGRAVPEHQCLPAAGGAAARFEDGQTRPQRARRTTAVGARGHLLLPQEFTPSKYQWCSLGRRRKETASHPPLCFFFFGVSSSEALRPRPREPLFSFWLRPSGRQGRPSLHHSAQQGRTRFVQLRHLPAGSWHSYQGQGQHTERKQTDLLFKPRPPEPSKSLPSSLSFRSASKRARSASSLRICLSTCTEGPHPSEVTGKERQPSARQPCRTEPSPRKARYGRVASDTPAAQTLLGKNRGQQDRDPELRHAVD